MYDPTESPIDGASRVSSELDAIAALLSSAPDLHCVPADSLGMLLSDLHRQLDRSLSHLTNAPRARLHSV